MMNITIVSFCSYEVQLIVDLEFNESLNVSKLNKEISIKVPSVTVVVTLPLIKCTKP